jgi:hypothetical protein
MSNQTPIASDWTGDAEAPASSVASTSCYRGFEDVRVLAVVKAPSELIQIERQILLGNAVIGADHATLQQTPEVSILFV